MAEAKGRTDVSEAELCSVESETIRRSHLPSLLGFRLRRAETAMHRDFIQSLKPCDLTQKHFSVLLLIHENPGISQIGLCDALETDPNTMIAFIDRLSDRSLICRIRSTADRRKLELHVTTAGMEVVNEALRLIAEHEARFKSRFDDTELKQLMDYLDRISAAEVD